MADGYIGGEYVECQHYSVIEQYKIDEHYPEGWNEDDDLRCYCGEKAPYRAKVAFHQKMRDDEPYGWGNSISMEYTVDRCEDHKFNPDPDCRQCRQDDVATIDVTSDEPPLGIGLTVEGSEDDDYCLERLRSGYRIHVHEGDTT